jgi:predicted DNA-binding transcriptional regulator YafY
MTKRESFLRYYLIINKVRKNQCTYNEILDYLKSRSEILGYDLSVSRRTFRRDLDDILSIFNIEIRYNYSRKVYYIEGFENIFKDKMLEALDYLNVVQTAENLSDIVFFESRRLKGTEFICQIIYAIKNRYEIHFTYQKFWDVEISQRRILPLALKEYKNYWYVFSIDTKDGKMKSFALDRLSDLEILNKKFKMPQNLNIEEYWKNCFGIIGPNSNFPDEVILSFHPEQGKYIKSLPLHESQEILIDNENEVRVRLKVFLTFDFKMEVLSHGELVKVIQPKSLVDDIRNTLTKNLNQYNMNL